MSSVLLLNGGSLVDATGRHTLTANDGAVTSSGGRLSFDGASSLRIDDNLSDFSFAGDFTIEGEIVGVTAGAGTEVFLSNYVGQNGDFEIFTRGSPTFVMGFFSTSGVYVETGPAVVDDTVHSFAWVRSGTTMSYYIDGARVAQDSSGFQDYTMDTPSSLFIGREGSATKFFKGLLRLHIDNGTALYSGTTYTPRSWTSTISASALQALDGVTQSATSTGTVSATAAQALAAVAQASVATVTVKASAAQSLSSITQTSAAAVMAQLTAAQSLANVAQLANTTVPAIPSFAATQLLASVSQVAAVAVVAKVSGSQTLANVVQDAVTMKVLELAASQALNAVSHAATVGVIAKVSGAQSLQDAAQAAAIEARISVDAAQALAGVVQQAGGTVADWVYHFAASQVLANVGQFVHLQPIYLFVRDARTWVIAPESRAYAVLAESRAGSWIVPEDRANAIASEDRDFSYLGD